MATKLLHVITTFGEGGVTSALHTMIDNGFYDAFDARLVCLAHGKGTGYSDLMAKLGPDKVGSIIPDEKKWPSVKDVPRILFGLNRELNAFNPSTVVFSSTHAIFLGRMVASLHPGVRIATFEHSARKWGFLVSNLLRLTSFTNDLTLGDSATTLAAAGKYYIRKTHSLEVPLAVAKPGVPRQPEKPSQFHILSLGRLVDVKNYGELIRAVSLLSRENYNIQLTLAGDGELLNQLKKTASECGIADRIKFPGFVADKRALHDAAHIYVQPSLFEGQCLGVTEAMTAGMPVVASDVGGMCDYGIDGVNMIKIKGFSSGDKELKAEKIADALRFMMDNYSTIAAPMSAAAIATAQDHFGKQTVKAKWKIADTALALPRGARPARNEISHHTASVFGRNIT